MPVENGKCERKRQLLQDVLQVFSRVSGISESQVHHQGGTDDASQLENELQLAIREQQQAIAALEDHQREHGC